MAEAGEAIPDAVIAIAAYWREAEKPSSRRYAELIQAERPWIYPGSIRALIAEAGATLVVGMSIFGEPPDIAVGAAQGR